jgi:hypothetical protein
MVDYTYRDVYGIGYRQDNAHRLTFGGWIVKCLAKGCAEPRWSQKFRDLQAKNEQTAGSSLQGGTQLKQYTHG